MSRYVDADDVIELFGIEDEDLYAIHTIEDAIYNGSLRTVDAVPVVRCNDCRHKDVLPDMYGIGTEALYCPVIEHYVEHDFYCKHGEKVTE